MTKECYSHCNEAIVPVNMPTWADMGYSCEHDRLFMGMSSMWAFGTFPVGKVSHVGSTRAPWPDLYADPRGQVLHMSGIMGELDICPYGLHVSGVECQNNKNSFKTRQG